MLPSSTLTRHIEGVVTDVLLQSYADRILVLVTQLGKVGSLVQATIPPTEPLLPAPPANAATPDVIPLPIPPSATQLTPLLGNAPSEHLQTLHNLYASQVATIIWTEGPGSLLEDERRPVVVGIALQKTVDSKDVQLSEQDRTVFHEVMSMVRELLRPR